MDNLGRGSQGPAHKAGSDIKSYLNYSALSRAMNCMRCRDICFPRYFESVFRSSSLRLDPQLYSIFLADFSCFVLYPYRVYTVS
jgi:hypothetical protein